MNAETLLEHYGRIAEASGAIDRLRGFVLDLAVRGKLVPQLDHEESAELLLQRISNEKARRTKTGEVRLPKTIPPAEDPPCALPSSWRWTCIAEIGFLSPRIEADDGELASFVPMPMIAAELGVAHQHEPRKWGEIKKGYTHFAEGDVGLAKITPCFENGKSTVFRNLTGGIGSGTTELHVVRPVLVSPDYVLLFLKSSHFVETGIPRMTGTAGQKRVPAEYFAYTPFPLPPLAEQRRIVTKVDELMALCDRLEAARTQREATRDRLTASTLAHLNTPEVPASPDGDASKESSFQSDARFALKVLPVLTARPDQIKQLRQTILDLAVRGRLRTGCDSDESAQALLDQIGRISGRSIVVAECKAPFAIPAQWRWSSVGGLSTKTGSGSTPRGGKEVYKASGVMFLRSQNIYDDGLRLNDVVFIDAATHDRMSGTAVATDDLLLNITGGSIGRCALVRQADINANVSQHVAIIRLAIREMSPYLHLVIRSPYFQSFVIGEQTGAGRGGLPKNRMDPIMVPVPPLAEQHRIVAKVDELMAFCDQLEASLTNDQNTRGRLLDALLHEALAPAESLLEAA